MPSSCSSTPSTPCGNSLAPMCGSHGIITRGGDYPQHHPRSSASQVLRSCRRAAQLDTVNPQVQALRAAAGRGDRGCTLRIRSVREVERPESPTTRCCRGSLAESLEPGSAEESRRTTRFRSTDFGNVKPTGPGGLFLIVPRHPGVRSGTPRSSLVTPCRAGARPDDRSPSRPWSDRLDILGGGRFGQIRRAPCRSLGKTG